MAEYGYRYEFSNGHDLPPPKTADQIIQEIDEIIEQSNSEESQSGSVSIQESSHNVNEDRPSLYDELESKIIELKTYLNSADQLEELPTINLESMRDKLKVLIEAYNECLVAELAQRDELQYEKELKNTFISLVSSIHSKRRQFVNGRKTSLSSIPRQPLSSRLSFPVGNASEMASKGSETASLGSLPQFLTAVIPFDEAGDSPSNDILAALIKVLKAVNEDSPKVPNLLTDYILNVLCPSRNNEVCPVDL